MSVPINPDTKIGELLDGYPGIEQKLIEWVPAFEKLRNPILRKTVAKVATLEQAARIGGVSVRELVRKLRDATGQGDMVKAPAATALLPVLDDGPADTPPAWLNDALVKENLDADTMLETREHPVGRIRSFIATAAAGDILRLTSSFRPAPLIDMLVRGGSSVYSTEIAPGRHLTYVCPKPASGESPAIS
jgi:hypothetical protein